MQQYKPTAGKAPKGQWNHRCTLGRGAVAIQKDQVKISGGMFFNVKPTY